MNSAATIALSGLAADQQWLGTIASNLANAQEAFALPQAAPGGAMQGGPVPFQPATVALSVDATGAVVAQTVPQTPAYMVAYDPAAPFANVQGLVGMPAVDLARQVAAQAEAMANYRANLAVMAAAGQMTAIALNLVA